jgi:tRNA-binding EMAP/Myf-like protein
VTISFDEFLAVDMRVGRVVEVEEFPEARKPAWKLTIDFGPEIGVKRSSAQIKNYSILGYTMAETNGFAFTALERRLKIIGVSLTEDAVVS